MLDFLGIGAHKSATTWLYTNLSRHPKITFPAGKELHFWDANRERGEAWWRSLFPAAGPGVRQGEITPAYAILPVEDIVRIQELYPALRLLYSIRNPIARAWAHARFAASRRGVSVADVSDQRLIEHFESPNCVRRGDHLENLKRWESVFPKSQIQVIFYDDIVVCPEDVLAAAISHIGADPADFPAAGAELRDKVLAGPDIALRPRLRDHLVKRYREDIKHIEQAFGRPLAHWLDE